MKYIKNFEDVKYVSPEDKRLIGKLRYRLNKFFGHPQSSYITKDKDSDLFRVNVIIYQYKSRQKFLDIAEYIGAGRTVNLKINKKQTEELLYCIININIVYDEIIQALDDVKKFNI